ncbi:rod shape-determining protein MreC [Brevundimonas bullata]|uniref:Cell shape-determining protein MreC n=1 Tax=Brevundimonas bullata TaxID=13160 RepID=A0A7W7N3A8_9CAUL|nr:rod shape-determining protein MreC [Brevundimonas bullata]MBB4797251.1 rod shape-determining protein MreC [Brevundimonas bullata]MBB6382210.1 rod shape-determining protein MreC [Brevundimonas bullata]
MAFRDGPFENLKVPLAWTAAVVVIVGIIGAVMLLLGDSRGQSNPDDYGAARAGFETGAAPVGGALSAPVRWTGNAVDYVKGYFFAVSENRRLRQQVLELSAWRDDALALKNLNGRYEQMLGVKTEPPVPMVTGLAITDARGPFARSRLLNIGAAKGVRVGNPVLSEHGLVGRIMGASSGHSRMLLLTDVASRTPVLVERTDARAMLTGDGSGSPRMDYVRGAGSIQEGDRILTSGDGGGFPRGLPIGIAAKGVDGSWRVKLFSDRSAIDYVRVLLFQDFSQLADQNALNAPPLASLAAAPPPTPAQAAVIQDVATRRAAAAAATAERVRAANAAPPPAPVAAPVAATTAPASTTTRPAAARPATAQPRPAAPRPTAPAPVQPAATPEAEPTPAGAAE